MGENPIVDLFGHAVADDDDIDISEQSPTYNASSLEGRYAEFMVCAYLTRIGLNVIHVDSVGFDLIINYEGVSYRVDVKSTSRSQRGPFKETVIWNTIKATWIEGHTTKKLRRKLRPSDADLLALFFRPLETVIFYPIIKPIGGVKMPLSAVRNAGDGRSTLRMAIEKLQKHRGYSSADADE